MARKQELELEIAQLRQQLRERERESRIMNGGFLVVNSLLTSANL
jgi:hypothetical protein